VNPVAYVGMLVVSGNAMKDKLLGLGYALALGTDKYILCNIVDELRKDGHAVTISHEVINGEWKSTTAHHYLTCTKCGGKP
jgi:hypothetical protein